MIRTWFPPNVGKPVPVTVTCAPGRALVGLTVSVAAAAVIGSAAGATTEAAKATARAMCARQARP
jgi:hypothetical protein